MATVKELLTNLGDSTRKFLGTSDTLSLEEMSVGIGKASDESDFQTELIEEFSNILDRSAAPDSYANGKEDGYADALDKRTDLVVTENGDYAPPDGITGFKSVTVEVASSGGGGDLDVLWDADSTTPTEVHSDVNSIRSHAFFMCKAITVADFPNATKMGDNAFQYCSGLTSVNMPNVTKISIYAFENCTALTSANFPSVTSISGRAFYCCEALTSANFPSVTSISSRAFYACCSLKAVILRSTTLCTLGGTDAFTSCYHILGTKNNKYNPNGDKDGYFYVPRALLSDDDATKDYRRATNWSTYPTQFRALEDYTVDGTITGALDPNKI